MFWFGGISLWWSGREWHLKTALVINGFRTVIKNGVCINKDRGRRERERERDGIKNKIIFAIDFRLFKTELRMRPYNYWRKKHMQMLNWVQLRWWFPFLLLFGDLASPTWERVHGFWFRLHWYIMCCRTFHTLFICTMKYWALFNSQNSWPIKASYYSHFILRNY